jgi:hypothetical protein
MIKKRRFSPTKATPTQTQKDIAPEKKPRASLRFLRGGWWCLHRGLRLMVATVLVLCVLTMGALLLLSQHPLPLGKRAEPLLAAALEQQGYAITYQDLVLGFNMTARRLELRGNKLLLSQLPNIDRVLPLPQIQADHMDLSLHMTPLLIGKLAFEKVALQGFTITLWRDPIELAQFDQSTAVSSNPTAQPDLIELENGYSLGIDAPPPADQKSNNWWQSWPAWLGRLNVPIDPTWPNLQLSNGLVQIRWSDSPRQVDFRITDATLKEPTPHQANYLSASGTAEWRGWSENSANTNSNWRFTLGYDQHWQLQITPLPLNFAGILQNHLPEPWKKAADLQANLWLFYNPDLPAPLSAVLELPPQRLNWPEVFPQEVALKESAVHVIANPKEPELALAPSTLVLADAAGGGEAKIELTGSLLAASAAPALLDLNLNAKIHSLGFNDLPKLWPLPLAVNPRAWVTTHLRDGRAESATAKIGGQLDPQTGALSQLHASGTIIAKGVTVDYLPPLPPVVKVDGVANFTESGMNIDLSSGHQASTRLNPSKVALTGFLDPHQFVDLNLDMTGPLADAMAIVGHPTLKLVQQLGLEPGAITGDAKAQLTFHIPLEKSLKLADVPITANAKLTNVRVAKLIRDQDITDGDVTLALTNQGLTLAGNAKLGGSNFAVNWQEWFNPKATQTAPKKSAKQAPNAKELLYRQIAFKGAVTPAVYQAFGLPDQMLAGGALQIDGQYKVLAKDVARVAADWQGDQAAIRIDQLNWQKPVGQPLRGNFALTLQNSELALINNFVMRGDSAINAINIDVAAKIDPKTGNPLSLQAKQFKLGRNDLTLNLTHKNQVWVGQVKAKAIDLQGLLESPANPKTPTKADKSDKPHEGIPEIPEAPAMQLDVAVDQLYLANGVALKKLRGQLQRTSDHWQSYRLIGDWLKDNETATEGTAVQLQLIDQTDPRLFTMKSNNAGQLLQGLNINDHLRGGALTINAVLTNPGDNRAYTGSIQINDLRLAKVPLLARIITLAFPTGLLQTLGGEGIAFDQLYTDIARQQALLTLTNGRLRGTSLGLTMKGQVDLNKSQLDLSGVVVPAYMLNNLFARIPLIGDLLGGDADGGLLASNYRAKGPIDDPSVSVNPLSLLTPGALRGIFGSGAPTTTPPTPKP